MRQGILKPAMRYGREVIKSGMAAAFIDTGLAELFARVRRMTSGPRVHVLGYHRVVDELDFRGVGSLVNPPLCVTTETFRKQMEQVQRHFIVLSLEDAMRAIDGQLYLDRDAVAITFDDGYYDVYARAMPILRELDLPATVFVPTGYSIDGGYLPHDRLYAAFHIALRKGIDLAKAPVPHALTAWLDKAMEAARSGGPTAAVELLLGWLPGGDISRVCDGIERLTGGQPALDRGASVVTPAEIHQLAEAGWEIGAHTIEHAVLTHESPERIEEELVRPRIDIERWTGKQCRYFAYCNGYHSRSLVDAVRRAGYHGAVTTCDRPNRPGGDVWRVSRKCLWEAHARGTDGNFSPALSLAQLCDLFGDLGMTRPVDGEISDPGVTSSIDRADDALAGLDEEVISCAT